MRPVKRFAALILALALTLSLLCVPALADVDGGAALTLNRASVSLAAGQTTHLEAAGTGEQDIQWTSTNTNIIQVDEDGTVTALAEGQAAVRATAEDGTSAVCTVSVHMALPSYSLREGEQLRLHTELSDAEWSSTDRAVAEVDEDGVVTAQGFGRACIVAESGSERESFSVTVGAHVGIDISSWNNAIDWDALHEQGIEFVFIRAGYGWEHTDARFTENIEGAIANNMPVGIYFYSYAETAEKAQVEANYCAKLLAPYKDDIILPVAYDLEQYSSLSGAQLVEFSKIFCTTLQNAGFHTMVYANGTFFSKMDLTALSDAGVDYWYAWYPTVPDLSMIHTIRGSAKKPSIWQYTSSAVVQGALASGKTDVNVMYMPEELTFAAPKLTARNTAGGAQLTWGGSTYASAYTLYRKNEAGEVQTVGTYGGTVHTATDADFLPGMGYFVTMEISDPLDRTYYGSYTSETAYPAAAMFQVTALAGEGGTAAGGGSFIVGRSATVTAAPAEGYTFDGWYDAAGKKVSAQAEYTFTVTASVALTARFQSNQPPVAPPATSSFSDVEADAWYAGAVSYVVDKHLFTGASDTLFLPMGTMDRSMLVTVLYRLAGSPEASNRNKFVDVAADAWYARAVTWAYNSGIVTGTGEKTFSPTDPVSREQIATILMRYSNTMAIEVPETTEGNLTQFTDSADISPFAQEGVRWAVATQLMNGANQKLTPRGNASRAECATILMRWLESSQEQ